MTSTTNTIRNIQMHKRTESHFYVRSSKIMAFLLFLKDSSPHSSTLMLLQPVLTHTEPPHWPASCRGNLTCLHLLWSMEMLPSQGIGGLPALSECSVTLSPSRSETGKTQRKKWRQREAVGWRRWVWNAIWVVSWPLRSGLNHHSWGRSFHLSALIRW